ncbi:MAG: lysophospholipid acyltransferase family protein [Anaerolineales bacterium]
MRTTIYTTPIITPALRGLFQIILRLAGWRVVGQLPHLPKYIIVGAPHTSNWDFVMFLALALVLKGDMRYMGKAELFRSPLGGFFRWCGGVPVDRSKPQGLVEQTVQAIREAEHFRLVITPEGTRKQVTEWKRGFYYIARQANIPIVAGFVDSQTKTCGIGPIFTLSSDIEADLRTIQSFFKDKVGINPKLTSELSK